MIQVHRIGLKLSNAYLIQDRQKAILVDAGMPGEGKRILSRLREVGITELMWIYLTHAHYDHVGSTAEIRRATGAQVVIQEKDVEPLVAGKTLLGEVRGRGRISAWMLPLVERLMPVDPVEPDIVFQDRLSLPDFGTRIEALHLPGHTLGSSGLLVDDRLFFAGDLLSTTGVPHAQRFYAQDWEALEQSLKLVKDLGPGLSYPGHGPAPLDRQGLLGLQL
ncbi:MAG: MBL fold metallo-hydrolase [Anaerolineales bacterium]|jgi:glyoxylase-like metal-dependent hydrolase (beta-lactamase superfamily II)